jgi:predicted MFS family arabinose efflux permease
MSARIYLLAAGAFAVGTSAYVVSGVLPAVSAELDVSVTAAGQLTTVFALAYAVSAPLLATVTARWERRSLLLAALLVAALGNALSAVATTYPLLLTGRIVAALGAAAYTPAATLFATALRPPAERGRAVAIVFGGLTVALALGVPMGSLLAGGIGYRGVFALVAAVSLVTAVAVRLQLPLMAGSAAVPLRERFAAAADGRVLTVLAITVSGVVATMCVYIYVVPLLSVTTGLDGSIIGALLLAYGLGAIVGNWWGGRATDRFGSVRTLFATMAGFMVMIATLPVTATTAVGAGLALFVWSVFTWSFNPPVQALLLELAPSGGLVLSLNASAIYLGMGLAGVLGGVVVDTAGALALPQVGAALGLVSVVLLLMLRSRTRSAAAVLVD